MYKHKCTQWFLDQEGYLEKSKEAYLKNPSVLNSKTDGAGKDNYTKYGKIMHELYPKVMDFPAYWCDCFVDCGFYTTYGVANAKGLIGDFDDYTIGSINLYKKKNAFFLKGEKIPEEGDQVFFTSNKSLNGVHHTGYVYKVENNRIHTVEGNTTQAKKVIPNGGAVCLKNYSINDAQIYGYGRPNYALYEKEIRKEYYKKDETIEVTKLLKDGKEYNVTGKLKITNAQLIIREKPDYAVRNRWFKTKDGYISAYRLTGWIKEEDGRWWYLKNDYKYPVSCEEFIDGKSYLFDSKGYMISNDRIGNDGHVIY